MPEIRPPNLQKSHNLRTMSQLSLSSINFEMFNINPHRNEYAAHTTPNVLYQNINCGLNKMNPIRRFAGPIVYLRKWI
jgi:hypothetical protein